MQWCSCPLEVREALAGVGDDGLVILTDLKETDLGADVLARFARGRLFSIESWRMLREAFQARQIDPQLRGCSWMADLLLERQPLNGYPPVPAGVLDASTAWRALLAAVLGLDAPQLDIDSLLDWTLDEERVSKFARLSEVARNGIAQYLRTTCGPGGSLVVDTLLAGNATDAVALGLVCDVVFSDGWTATDLLAAAVRLEPLVGRSQIAAPAARQWVETSMRVLRRHPDLSEEIFERAEDILSIIHAAPHVARSAILPSAFDRRLTDAAWAMNAALDGGMTPASMAAAEQACARVLEHSQATLQAGRCERLRMASRLLRWLALDDETARANFEEAATSYVLDGGYVDWARSSLIGGDPLAPMSALTARLTSAVREKRERQNREFALAFRDWNKAAGPSRTLTPVEDILDRVVAVAATKAPVLLLVMDGLNYAIFRRLAEDLGAFGWNELAIDGQAIHSGVSIVPTVTEIARTSLLCGRICRGSASTEKTGFAAHVGLLRICQGTAPILFHKGDLADGGVLAEAVRSTLGDPQQRVVGLVYNAVDDHLSGADQAPPRWSIDDLHLLAPILHEARNAGRLIIITADHGHVLEDGTRQAGKGVGDRWKNDSVAGDVETNFDQGRVLTPEGKTQVVVPWSEQVRYGSKKAGYHGGVSPQEVLVPLAVFCAAKDEAPIWDFAMPSVPDWWQPAPMPTEETAGAKLDSKELRARRSKKAAAPTGQPNLFELPPQLAADIPVGVTGAKWIDAFLASAGYRAQVGLAGKNAPKDDDVRAVIAALERRGRLPRTALAKQIGIPLFRINGFLANIRRVINLDQTPILEMDEGGEWVQLDVKELVRQFEIEGHQC